MDVFGGFFLVKEIAKERGGEKMFLETKPEGKKKLGICFKRERQLLKAWHPKKEGF